MARARRWRAVPALIPCAAVLCGAVLCAAGCGGDADTLANSRNVTLTGGQVSSTNTSSATGTASVVVSLDKQSITVITRTTGLGTIVSAHIHAGLTGTAGLMRAEAPVIFTLFESTQGGSNGEIIRTLASPNLTAQSSVGISTFSDAVRAILAGRAYIDFHTTAFPNGEIRGQILPASFTARLSGDDVTPPSGVTGSGSVTVTIDAATCTISVSGTTAGLTNSTVTAVDMQVGAIGTNGPVIFPVFEVIQGPFAGSFNRTLTDDDLVVQKAAGVNTCNDAINAIILGNTYINVRTVALPNGALRGQLTATVN
jgi:hypothetical protein